MNLAFGENYECFAYSMKMTETELIKKIQELRKISPRKDWVSLTKSQIFGKEPEMDFSQNLLFLANKLYLKVSPIAAGIIHPFRFFLGEGRYKPVLIVLAFLFILTSTTFVVAQNSLPGDFLYSLKKITERGQSIFVSERQKPSVQLELVNKRLEELAKITENNQTKKLAPALSEIKTTKDTVNKELSRIIENKPRKEAIKIVKEIAPRLKEIEEREKEVFAILGVEPPEDEGGEISEKTIAEFLINDLKNSSLTPVQENLLTEAEEDYQAGDYSGALEKAIEASWTK